MSRDEAPPPVLAGIASMDNLPPEVTRVVVRTNGRGTPPPGWKEGTGAMHIGKGIWLVPYVRVSKTGGTA